MGFALKSQVRTDDRWERCNTAVLWRGCRGRSDYASSNAGAASFSAISVPWA
jgi:hypothetical protein